MSNKYTGGTCTCEFVAASGPTARALVQYLSSSNTPTSDHNPAIMAKTKELNNGLG